MTKLKWHVELEIGDEFLDLEHMLVFQLIDESIELARNGATNEELTVRLNEIIETLSNHFKNEEANSYQHHSDFHKKQHKYLLNLMRSKLSELADSENKKITAQEILVTLYDWCLLHIKNEDRQLVSQAA